MLRCRICLLAAGLMVIPAGWNPVASGQEQRREAEQPPEREVDRQGTRARLSDGEVVGWLLVDNEAEILLSQAAQRQASSPQVKEFAGRMVQDHTQMVQKLQSVLGQRGPADGRRTARNAPGEAGAVRLPPELLRDSPLLAAYAEVGRRTVRSAQEMLGAKKGPAFDLAFMHLQVHLHNKALATLETFQQQASPELKPLLRESGQAIQQHLKMAQSVASQLERGATARTPVPTGTDRPAPQPR